MKRFFVTVGTAFAVSLLALPALADSPTYNRRVAAPEQPAVFNYTGLYLDIAGGKAFTAAEVSVPDHFNIDSLALEGWRGQARIGADWQLAQSPFLIGVFGGYGLGETEFNFDVSGAPATVLNGSLTPTWHAGARVGLVNGKTLFYVGAAWQQADFDVSVLGKGITNQTVDGWKGLVGLEYVVTQQLSLGLEYGHTWYDEVNVSGANVDLRDHEVMLRLKWRPMTGLFNN